MDWLPFWKDQSGSHTENKYKGERRKPGYQLEDYCNNPGTDRWEDRKRHW